MGRPMGRRGPLAFERVGAILRLLAGLPLAAALLAGCDGGRSTGPAPVTLALGVQGGDKQSGAAGALLGEPLQVVVKNAVTGEPVPAVEVRFTPAPGSDATPLDTVATTGLDGVARVDVRLGTLLGADQPIIEATLTTEPGESTDERVVFTATVTPAPTLTGISDSSVAAGDTVTLTGSNFNVTDAGNVVRFGGVRAQVLSGPTATSLRVVVPACVEGGSVDVVVEVGSAVTNAVSVSYDPGAGLGLAELQGATVTGDAIASCLGLSGGGASYVVVPQFATATAPLDETGYLIGSTEGAVVTRPPVAVPGERLSLPARFEGMLRERERELSAAGARAPAPALSRAAGETAPPAVGSTRTFRVLSSLTGSDFKTVTARLGFAGTRILIYVDQQAPGGSAGLSDAQLQAFGEWFDRDLYGVDVRTFGTPSDIDGNGRVIVLMTPVVNALTPSSQCSTRGFVAGFFFGFDLAGTGANSNQGEIFYSLAPDPTGRFSCAHSASQIAGLIPPTFVHELQHMISFNQHVLVRGGPSETVWLNEGLSHVAEEMAARLYQGRSGLPPGPPFTDTARVFIGGNAINSYRYLRNTPANSVTTFESGGSLEERGGAWLFLRWLGDQKDSTIYARLVQTSRTSVDNVSNMARESFPGLFGDFSLALYTDSIPGVARSSVPPRYRFRSRNLRALYSWLYDVTGGGEDFPVRFPLEAMSLPVGGDVSASMVPGTMAFYRLDTPGGSGTVGLRYSTPAGNPFAPRLGAQVTVFRLP